MPSNRLILCCPLLLPSVFPSIRSFPMGWLFTSGGQSIWTSASILPMNIQGWFPLGLTGLISSLKGGPRELDYFRCLDCNIHIWKLEMTMSFSPMKKRPKIASPWGRRIRWPCRQRQGWVMEEVQTALWALPSILTLFSFLFFLNWLILSCAGSLLLCVGFL